MDDIQKTTRMLRNKAEGAPDQAKKVMLAVAEGLQRDIQERAPKKTGAMAASIKVEFSDPMTVKVTGNAVAGYQEYGTKPHVILPKNKPYLVFKTKDGRIIRTKKVNHPGTKPQPFIRPAVNEVMEDLGDKLGRMGAALNDYEGGA